MRTITGVVQEIKQLDRAMTEEEMSGILDEVSDQMLQKFGYKTKQVMLDAFSDFQIRNFGWLNNNADFIWFLEDPEMPF